MTDLRPVVLPALAGTLLEQVQAFGLLGCYSAPTMDDLEWLAETKTKPLILMLDVLEHVANCNAIPSELPLLYHTAGWPTDAPPAGYARETTSVCGRDHISSLFAFWTLQIRNKDDPGPASYKLVRAALWVARAHGLAAALRYLFALFDAGFVIQPAVASNAIWLLLDARRRVRSETDVASFLLKTLPEAPDAWTLVDFRNVLLTKLHPSGKSDLADELDLLCDLMSDQIAGARAATDVTDWILGQARLGIAAAAVVNVFRWAEVNHDLAYAGFAAQFDEIAADSGGFFSVARTTSPIALGDRLAPSWAGASAMAAIATTHEPEWLDRILEERVLVPDALRATYIKNPRKMAMAVSPEWRAPSPKVVPIMVRLIIRDDRYAVRPTEAFDLLTNARLKAATLELGHPINDTFADLLVNLFRAVWSDQPGSLWDKINRTDMQSFGGKFVPRKDLAALLTGLGMPEKELEAWLGMLLAAVGGAHAKSSLVDAMKQATAGDRSGCMFSLDALLRIYPAFAPLRLERAIQLDTNGQSRAAWDEMTAALQLDSGNGLAWQSAGVILNRLGLRDDAMMAAATAYVIQNGSEA